MCHSEGFNKNHKLFRESLEKKNNVGIDSLP